MVLDVLRYPNKILKQKSRPVVKFDERLRQLAAAMLETMYADGGVGLAAPQVGVSERVIVVDVAQSNRYEKQLPTKNDAAMTQPPRREPHIFINPVIVGKRGEIVFEEGCLSCPGMLVEVQRAAEIDLDYLDCVGQPQRKTLAGLFAVCVQHEIDHLNGVLLVDRLSRLKREMYRRKSKTMAVEGLKEARLI